MADAGQGHEQTERNTYTYTIYEESDLHAIAIFEMSLVAADGGVPSITQGGGRMRLFCHRAPLRGESSGDDDVSPQ